MQKILFSHLPKSAGKSITEYIQKFFSDDECMVFLFDESFLKKRSHLLQAGRYFHMRLFAGHLSHIYFDMVPASFRFTFMRDPVDRVLSNYFYWRQEHPDVSIAVNGDNIPLIDNQIDWEQDLERLMSYVSHNFKVSELSNLMTFQFSHGIYSTRYEEPVDAYRLAMRNLLDLNFLGFYEHLEQDLSRLSDLLGNGITNADVPHINPTIQRIKRNEISSNVKELIEKNNIYDLELYDIFSSMRKK